MGRGASSRHILEDALGRNASRSSSSDLPGGAVLRHYCKTGIVIVLVLSAITLVLEMPREREVADLDEEADAWRQRFRVASRQAH